MSRSNALAAAPPLARPLAVRAMTPLLAAAALSVATPGVVDAQHWREPARWTSVSGRQAEFDHRIAASVRNGQLTRREVGRLKAEFNALVRLEAQYRRGGLTRWERADLDRRFDRLSSRVRTERRPYRRAGRW